LREKDNKLYRMPTEAEWEYACRAGTTTPFYFGETISTDRANYKGTFIYGSEQQEVYRQKTTPVGCFPANAWGLHDMHGNVWQWCQDRYSETYYAKSPVEDPQGPADGNHRVIRGGCWGAIASSCRSATRYFQGDRIGFRVVCQP
jgi:formylglycine-generating enzyme required for sulfatase activity